MVAVLRARVDTLVDDDDDGNQNQE